MADKGKYTSRRWYDYDPDIYEHSRKAAEGQPKVTRTPEEQAKVDEEVREWNEFFGIDD